jgi:tetratricopeptide (TPR) repeat protein
MNIFKIIAKLYKEQDCEWIDEIPSNQIQPVVIQKFLSMNVKCLPQVRWLDKFVFNLPPKMYLALAWAVLPKYQKAPYVKYIKELDMEEKYKEVLEKIKSLTKMSDNDYKHNKKYILKAIDKNPNKWFVELGMDKKSFKKYKLDYNNARKISVNKRPVKGLLSYT